MVELEVAEIIGTIAFALSGFYVAIKERLDLLGIFIASFLTALGGGIVRDTIVQRAPSTFTHMLPSLLVIGVIVLSIALKLHQKDEIEKTFYFIISDTLGLVSFSISGALIGLQAEFNFFGVVLMALITAVGGGVLRDILLNRVPFLLTSEFYGTVSLLVGAILFAFDAFGIQGYVAFMVVFAFGVSLRLLAYYKKWNLPKIG
ncbi:MAG: trimeric intracellular cation channel family protein [Epsilonproteobacteria bacterium]|uniref:trimeric intracellular cation channel family protein n=1 Tax=Sulfurospirillum cavolei TaxID=366522 RepID=UPI0005A6696B|nr:trimeric intracellular cation channel family protein [Sulfurospirillum cavolei]MDY0265729.1 trimeric intracellular cation channel family protein [Sulfurospirillum cavolei]NCB54844.1 trimeric intracellular cation channel family protein [Campylobacterota bacterium]